MTAEDLSNRNSLHVTKPTRPRFPDDVFSRIFPGLFPFAPPTEETGQRAQKLGVKDGILDAKDNLTDPIQSITNPAVFSPNNSDNPNMTAGVTFFGQFLDHDLVSREEVLHYGTTGAGQIAKIEIVEDRGSARIVPFFRSPTRTVERVPRLDAQILARFASAIRPPVHACRDRGPVPKPLREATPLTAVLGDIQDGVQDLQIVEHHVAALCRQASLEVPILSLGEFHVRSIA